MPIQAVHHIACSRLRKLFCLGARRDDTLAHEKQAQQSVDTWAPTARRSSVSSLTSPSQEKLRGLTAPAAQATPRDYDATIRSLIAQLNEPGYFVRDLANIELTLCSLIEQSPDRIEAYLWRGIAKRIGAKDGRDDLRAVLKKHPNHRLAALNLVAMSLTCVEVRLEDGAFAEAKRLVHQFCAMNDRDRFAGLLAILIERKLGLDMSGTIRKLEEFYLEHPDYVGAIACLAASFSLAGNRSACLDFAQEAQRKDKYCLLAHNLLTRDEDDRMVGVPLSAPYVETLGFVSMGYDGFLSGPYYSSDIEFDMRKLNAGV